MKIARLLASVVVLLPFASGAQSKWPEKPVHIIVPFSAGSATDIIARTIVERLNAEIVKVLESPETKQRFTALGAEPMIMTPAEFDAFLKAETARMQQVVTNAKIPVQ